MSELHLLDILAARHGCFISDLNLTPFLRRAALADLCGMEESAHPLYQWQDAVRYLIEGGYLCFEEDCDAQVALRELMDKKMIQAPVNERFGPGAYEAVINSSVQIHHPEYWQAREKAISEQNRQAKKKGRER